MKLASLVFKNVLRQKTRTALTLLGISIGIATILSLGAVADGLKASFGGFIKTGKADFTVAQAGSSDLALSRIDDEVIERLREVDGVQQVEGASFGITPYEKNPYFIVIGVRRSALPMAGFKVIDGRAFGEGSEEVLLGKLAADRLGKDVGDDIRLFGKSFEVVGVYESGEQMQDSGAAMPLATVQRDTKTDGKVTIGFVVAEEGTDVSELTARIDDEFSSDLVTIKDLDEVSRADQGIEAMNGAVWMISALAIIIGGIGVMNTMIISVFDRIREIGVLKAVGWRRRTVMLMILGEAVLIGLASVVVGTGLAMAVLVPLSSVEVVQGFLQPSYTWQLWARATGVAVTVSIVGGLYPAWRAANLSPVEALRYE